MKRTQARLAHAAEQIQADLRRTTGRPWRCSVDADLVLTVANGALAESVLLDAEVQDVEWFVPQRTTAQVEDGLAEDAEEAVADELVEVMRVLGERLPVCPKHGRVLGSCSGVWTCNGPPAHDIALGALGRDVESSGRLPLELRCSNWGHYQGGTATARR